MAVKDGLPATDFSRMNREYIKAVAGESGGGLPEITEADEGKVLTVESGEAAWAEGGGGESNVVLVTLTYDEDADDGTYISDKTKAEIVGFYNDGKVVICGIGDNTPRELFLCNCLDVMGNAIVEGNMIRYSDEDGTKGMELSHYFIPQNETNKWTVDTVYCEGI